MNIGLCLNFLHNYSDIHYFQIQYLLFSNLYLTFLIFQQNRSFLLYLFMNECTFIRLFLIFINIPLNMEI